MVMNFHVGIKNTPFARVAKIPQMNSSSETNDHNILQFMSITSVDHDVASVFLEQSGYNLDSAVNAFYSLSSKSPEPKKIADSGSDRNKDPDYVAPLESLPQPKVNHYYFVFSIFGSHYRL
jgi:hypothetical protein